MRAFIPLYSILLLSLLILPATAQEEKKENPRERPRPEGREVAPRQPRAEGAKPDQSPKASQRPWVGVATSGIEDSLRSHLELEEGFGIQVIEVIPDSPANKAGLKRSDIITYFGDQRLISPEHLSLLVRTCSPGDEVTFKIIRKGAEESVKVTLGETDPEQFAAMRPHPPQPGMPQDGGNPDWQESMRRQQDYWQNWMNENRPEWRGNPMRNRDKDRNENSGAEKPMHPGEGRPPSVSVNPGFPLRVFGSEGVLKIDNKEGEVTLTEKDGGHHIKIQDAEGKVIYDGPYDAAAGTESLPEEAGSQLDTMKLKNFDVLLPPSPEKDPEKTSSPSPEKKAPQEECEGPL
jgi:serine protease Do